MRPILRTVIALSMNPPKEEQGKLMEVKERKTSKREEKDERKKEERLVQERKRKGEREE